MAKKKINCKDGLEHNEEIQARRLRARIENGDEDIIREIRELYAEWYKKPTKNFLQWLSENDKKILSSALKRLEDWSTLII